MNYLKENETINKKIDSKIFDIGSCVKIKNSQKTFQVLGFNPKKTICWLREWPLNYDPYRTFGLAINQIKIQTFCVNKFSK